MRRVQSLLPSARVAACAFAIVPAQAKSDQSFMEDGAQAGAAEVEAIKLARTKARHADVKTFAESMITDHGKVADELKALAAKKNTKLPDGQSATQKAEPKLIDIGDNDKFDERYAQHFGVNAHKDTIKLFENAAKNAKDPELRAWAEKTLPDLRHHLEMAQALSPLPKR